MKYKSFGKTGISVSELIFGTWYLPNNVVAGKGSVNRDASIKLIQRAYDLGINFFDTADVYRGVYDRNQDPPTYETIGLAEMILGDALKGYDRESYVIATKVVGKTGPRCNDSGANRKHVRLALKNSLERLKMDYVDFYLIHSPDGVTGFDESARTMNMLQDDGLILHYGLSNFTSHDLVDFINIRKFEGPDFIQDKYNLIDRRLEGTNIKVAEKNSMASMIFSPLAQGVLAGRYLRDDKTGARLDYEKLFKGSAVNEKNRDALLKFKGIASSKGFSMAQLALSWLMHKGNYIFPIVGATKKEQLEESVQSSDVSLNSNEVQELEKLFEAH